MAEASRLGALKWRCIGPYRGGRVVAVAGDPVHAAVFYFGACAGGVWKTTDSGTTWQPISYSAPFSSVGALAVVQSGGKRTLYVGSGQVQTRYDVMDGTGVTSSVETFTRMRRFR